MEAADELVGIFEEGVGEEDARVRCEDEAVVKQLGRGGSTRTGSIYERKLSPFELFPPLSNVPSLMSGAERRGNKFL